MAPEDQDAAHVDRPSIQLTAPTFRDHGIGGGSNVERPCQDVKSTRTHLPKGRALPKHVYIDEPQSRRSSQGSNIYLGSYARSSGRSQSSLHETRADSPRTPISASPRTSLSHQQLKHLLAGVDVELDTYGLEEHRDGFFDASFYRPLERDRETMEGRASGTLPSSMQPHSLFPLPSWFLQLWKDTIRIVRITATTRDGVRLFKSSAAFMIAYVMCLAPVARDWLGNYNYICVISVIINHPGRSLGSQLDGAVLTTFGTVIGLLWGSLALYAATSTAGARLGYGGILATFLVVFTIFIAWLRCVYIRFYQAVICAGIAVCYTCLADTFDPVGWNKFSQYAIPWTIGQAIALFVCITFFPAAGTRPIATSFHSALQCILTDLDLPRLEPSSTKRDLAQHFVDISQAVRDFTIDLSISPYHPDDVRNIRNLIQGVLRSVAATRTNTLLFDIADSPPDVVSDAAENGSAFSRSYQTQPPPQERPVKNPTQFVSKVLASPTRNMIEALQEAIRRIDAALMDISGYRRYLGPPKAISSNVTQALADLRTARSEYDAADEHIAGNPNLSLAYADHPELIELLLFIQPLRQSLDKVEALLLHVLAMQEKDTRLRIHLPSYPLSKLLLRSNAQVRHDRGGLTAGFYFRSKRQLEKTMNDLQSKTFVPSERQFMGANLPSHTSQHISSQTDIDVATEKNSYESIDSAVHDTLRLRAWRLLHKLQGFEARFAVKVTIVTTLFSIPAWLSQSKGWWNNNESWWVVATIWVAMIPRVGGNLQDLVTRVSCAGFAALWGGISYIAGSGSPYVMAVFAVVFIIPMLYRFTLSSHPRSGLMGCLTFTVVSLSEYRSEGRPSVVTVAWARGFAFVLGVIAAVIVNWGLWPFVARYELRKSVSAMLLHCGILYRGIVAKYVYYDEGHKPQPEDIARSEMLEGRLREGFVRIRQLMELTRHEIPLRAPFDPVPYSALIDACECFFTRLLEVRQSSVYFKPYMLASNNDSDNSLLAVRRDAVAAILMNLYVLAGALRSNRPVPRYLPSAANARRRLLDKLEDVEAEQESRSKTFSNPVGRRWVDVYRYAYSAALTDIVDQLQQLQYYTKQIVGEIGFELENEKHVH